MASRGLVSLKCLNSSGLPYIIRYTLLFVHVSRKHIPSLATACYIRLHIAHIDATGCDIEVHAFKLWLFGVTSDILRNSITADLYTECQSTLCLSIRHLTLLNCILDIISQ
jgi:hypothetical protein